MIRALSVAAALAAGIVACEARTPGIDSAVAATECLPTAAPGDALDASVDGGALDGDVVAQTDAGDGAAVPPPETVGPDPVCATGGQ